MKGHVDDEGRALVSLHVYPFDMSARIELEAWIDTGFTGELVLPRELIEKLRLPKSGSIDAFLADGSKISLDLFDCTIDWFGSRATIEVMATQGEAPLLGVGLLHATELRINFLLSEVELALA